MDRGLFILTLIMSLCSAHSYAGVSFEDESEDMQILRKAGWIEIFQNPKVTMYTNVNDIKKVPNTHYINAPIKEVITPKGKAQDHFTIVNITLDCANSRMKQNEAKLYDGRTYKSSHTFKNAKFMHVTPKSSGEIVLNKVCGYALLFDQYEVEVQEKTINKYQF